MIEVQSEQGAKNESHKNLEKEEKQTLRELIKDNVKSIVYGGMDGILTVFAIVSSSLGSESTLPIILILGVTNVLSDGLSMALGDYLSTKTINDFTSQEREREEWEYENCFEGEKQEMLEIYQQKGMTVEDAEQLVDIMKNNKTAWLDTMVTDELGLSLEKEDPVKNGLITFASFLFFGLIPLMPYIIGSIFSIPGHLHDYFISSTVLTGFTLFILGIFKSTFTKQNWIYCGFECLFLGSIVAVAGYLIAYFIEPLAGKIQN